MIGDGWKVSVPGKLFKAKPSCTECHQLLNEWNGAARTHAERAVDLSRRLGTISREDYILSRQEVEAAQKSASEAHLSYRLHRSQCPVVLEQRREAS